MIEFKSLPLYVKKVTELRFQVTKFDKPYNLIIFPENCLFTEVYSTLNIRRIYVRSVIIPRSNVPRVFMSAALSRQYRSLKLVPHPTTETLRRGNVFSDLSYFLQAVEVRFHPKNYRSRYGNFVRDKILQTCDLLPDWRNVLLYIVDLRKGFPKSIFQRKIWPVIQMLHDENVPFDDLLLCTISDGPLYRLLVKEKNYTFPRTLSIIRSLEGIESPKEEPKPSDLDKVASEVVSKVRLSLVDKESKERLKDTVKAYLKERPDKLQQLEREVKPEDAISVVAASVIYHSTGSEENAERIALKIRDLKARDRVVSNLVSNVVDDLLPHPNVKPTSDSLIVKATKLNEIVDNKVPTHLFLKRQIDYEKNLLKDIEYCFKELETKDPPLKVLTVQVEKEKPKPGEVDFSDFKIIVVRLKDKAGKIHRVRIKVPNIDDYGTFNVYGRRKILINQIVLNPLTFPKPYESRLSTSYSTIRIHSKRTRARNYLQCFIGAYRLPAFVVFCFVFGFDHVVKLFNLKIDVVDKTPPKDVHSVKLGPKQWLVLDPASDEYQVELFSSFEMLKLSSYNIKFPFGSREYFHDLIVALTKSRNSTFKIQEIVDNILSPSVRQVLANKQQPHEIDKVFLYMCKKVVSGYVDERNDLNIQRIRNSEVISELVRKQLLASYNVYKERILSGDKNVKLDFSSETVLRSFMNSEIVQDIENINPIEELSVMTRVSPIGRQVGGIPDKNAIQISARNIHETYFGNIDPLDTPEGENVGVIQNLTVDAMITTSRGIIITKQRDEKERSGLLSTSVSLVPFVNSNDGCRVLFSCSQTKQALPLVKPEVPAVQTGYESLLTNLLSDHFLKKAPESGRITKVTDKFIVIDNKYKVSLEPKFLRSGQGKSSVSEFRPKVKVGDRVTKGQIIAEGSCVKNGHISVGRNLLTAVMPYKGYTFEDGIVVSSKLVDEDVFTSIHLLEEVVEFSADDTVEFIAQIGQVTKRGDHLLRRKVRDITELLKGEEEEQSAEEGLTEVVADMIIKRSPGGRIVDIDVYTNEDINKFPLLKPFFEKTKRKLPGGRKAEKFTKRGFPIEGVVVKFKIEQRSKVEVGDKLANRHGNKGVIALIEDADKMPRTPWGDPIELILNPLGIINRMNVGQLFELYCGLISKLAADQVIKNGKSGIKKSISMLQRLYSTLDKTDRKRFSQDLNLKLSKLSVVQASKLFDEIYESGFVPIIVPPFQSPGKPEIEKAMKVVGAKPYYSLTLPEFGVKTAKPVPVGYMYELKLEMQSELKVGARSVAGYESKTMQPTAGKRRKGGQRLGELDTYTLFSYGCTAVLAELFGPLSDDIISKDEMIQDIISSGSTKFRKPKANPTKDLLRAYMVQLMLTEK